MIHFLWSEYIKTSEIYRRSQQFATSAEAYYPRPPLPSHNNMHPHSMAVTAEAIMQPDFELLPHSSYNLDLAALDYHMF